MLIGNFMQGMLLTTLSSTSCKQLKAILLSPRPYGPGLHEFSKAAIDQYIINEKTDGRTPSDELITKMEQRIDDCNSSDDETEGYGLFSKEHTWKTDVVQSWNTSGLSKLVEVIIAIWFLATFGCIIAIFYQCR